VTRKGQNESFGIWISTRDSSRSEAELIEVFIKKKSLESDLPPCVRFVLMLVVVAYDHLQRRLNDILLLLPSTFGECFRYLAFAR
jgi:hypothetical protein